MVKCATWRYKKGEGVQFSSGFFSVWTWLLHSCRRVHKAEHIVQRNTSRANTYGQRVLPFVLRTTSESRLLYVHVFCERSEHVKWFSVLQVKRVCIEMRVLGGHIPYIEVLTVRDGSGSE